MLLNKKILFIVEKQAQAQIIQKLKVFEELSLNNEINFHYAHCIVPYYSYKYPNNLKYKDLPFICDLLYKLDIEGYNKKYPLKASKETPYYLSYHNLNKEFFLNYDKIVFATEQEGTRCYGAYLELEQVLGKDFKKSFETIHSISTNKLDEESLTHEINNSLNNEIFNNQRVNEFYKFVNKGKIKRYFDYNYQFNCNVFIKELYKYLFLKDFKDNQEFEETYSKYGFTKYMLLTILSYKKHLETNEKEYFYENEIEKYLYKYVGTGKYKNKYFIGLGSPASRAQIIINLINLKIINEINLNNKKTLKFNEKVDNMIMLLNKKIFDPDLPFRIEEWRNLDFEIAKEKIDKYIKEIFIKQKVKNKFIK